MNYKDTLNLPKTAFPMKAGLSVREPQILEGWEKMGLYSEVRRLRKGSKSFLLHDGPPYANGHIHIGHSLNKTLKDIVVKYKTMRGFDSPYVPGWDCHGLPIELELLKEIKKRKEEVDKEDFRKKARQYADNFINIQRDEFKRLGVTGDWENPYQTMDYRYQAHIAESFLELVEKGYIYQGFKPVAWCYECETALAEAELEYENKTSPAVCVKFPLKDFKTKSGVEPSILIWTTTPWTLPANMALAVHENLEYHIIKSDKGTFLIAAPCTEKIAKKAGLANFEIVKSAKGRELVGLLAASPYGAKSSFVLTADYVSAEEGTGIVHIAPGHGEEDFQAIQSSEIFKGSDRKILSPVNSKGRFQFGDDSFKHVDSLEGLFVQDANQRIIDDLRKRDLLIFTELYEHSYPHCWRCKKPIVFRATHQWFLRVDEKELRGKLSNLIDQTIKFIPAWGKNRIGSMVAGRPDWCLSRQRLWGVPIPVIRCMTCQDQIFTGESKAKIAEIFKKESADAWFTRPVSDFLPPGFKCGKCNRSEFKKENDIIDVWFDSGVSHQAVLKDRKGLSYPADLYLEGSDQHRGWFQSALITAVALEGSSPFHFVLTHGFVVDGEGKKMSKSQGNVISPLEVIKESGADILRLWVASCDYADDVRISAPILRQLSEGYKKIRNTFRYLLGNLYDFNPDTHTVSREQLEKVDRWAMETLERLLEEVTGYYEEYQYHKVYHAVYNFCVREMSSFYLDILKDRLYTFPPDSYSRRSAQTVLFHILSTLTRVVAPILVFTGEEIWEMAPSFIGKKKSVHLEDWPPPTKHHPADKDKDRWKQLMLFRDQVMKVLEEKREKKEIGDSLEASLHIETSDSELSEVLFGFGEEGLASLLVVSEVRLQRSQGLSALNIEVQRAGGKKCGRCWNYRADVGENPQHPGICRRCTQFLKGVYEKCSKKN